MKTSPCKRCGAYLGGAALSCLALWWAYGRYWADLLCWINANQALAGWVQAFGSIAALVATWLVTRHQLTAAERVRQRAEQRQALDLNRACLKAARTANLLLNSYTCEYRRHGRIRLCPDLERTQYALEVAKTLLAKELQGEALVAMIDCVTALGILLTLMQMFERGESWDTTAISKLVHARSLSVEVRRKLQLLVKRGEIAVGLPMQGVGRAT